MLLILVSNQLRSGWLENWVEGKSREGATFRAVASAARLLLGRQELTLLDTKWKDACLSMAVSASMSHSQSAL